MGEIDFREVIRKAIVKQKLSIPQVAEKAKLNKGTVYKYLKGDSEIAASNLESLLNAVNLSVTFQIENTKENK